jgi:hypothetical protein
MVQWAMLRAWGKYALGQQQVTWEPTRRKTGYPGRAAIVMNTRVPFGTEMQRPDGRGFESGRGAIGPSVEDSVVCHVENARLRARELIPENLTCCTRARDLLASANGSHSAACEECVAQIVAGEESA